MLLAYKHLYLQSWVFSHKNMLAGCHSLPDIAACTARLLLVQRLGEDRTTAQSPAMLLQTRLSGLVSATAVPPRERVFAVVRVDFNPRTDLIQLR